MPTRRYKIGSETRGLGLWEEGVDYQALEKVKTITYMLPIFRIHFLSSQIHLQMHGLQKTLPLTHVDL